MRRPARSDDRGRQPKADPRRQQLLAKIHVAKKQLGLDEPEYRALVARHGKGKDSAGDLTVGQLITLVEELKAKGWRAKAPAGKAKASPRRPARSLADSDHTAKIRALWLAGHDLGVVRDPSESALVAFVKRQSKVDDPRWLRPEQAEKVVEGLKAMLARAGVDWSGRGYNPRKRLVLAQAAKLGIDMATVEREGYGMGLPAGFAFYEDSHWTLLQSMLGRRVREMHTAADLP